MIGGVGEAPAPRIGRKGYQLTLRMDERHHTIHSGLLHGAVQYVPGFSQIVDACIVSPTVGGEDERRDVIELAIRGRTLCVARTVGLAAPCKVSFHRA